MSQNRETFGATQNEGSRHGGDSWGQGPETYGTTHNEPGRRSGSGQQGSSGGYVPSTGQSTWNGHQPNGHAGTYGTADNQPSPHRDSNGWGQSNGDANTYGTAGNQPPRHRNTEINVKYPNNGGSSSMPVDLDQMTENELVQKISRESGMNSGQLYVNHQGKPLSGSRNLRGAGLYHGCTVHANSRLRGG